VVQNNCIRCHENVISDFRMNQADAGFTMLRKERRCWNCHREVPHGRVNSLSSVPYARVPLPQSPVPGWMRKVMSKE
jgi:cytochrome c nitrite reductase small subunit